MVPGSLKNNKKPKKIKIHIMEVFLQLVSVQLVWNRSAIDKILVFLSFFLLVAQAEHA